MSRTAITTVEEPEMMPAFAPVWAEIFGKNPSRFQEPTHPVEQVSWNDCQAFVFQLNERVPSLSAGLPTEAHWEYACRAGTQGAFHIEGSKCTEPEGKDPVLDQLGWYNANSEKKTHPVKSKGANDWGLYDMHGNVLEWCRDGMREYSIETKVNPIGPLEEGAGRVVRGGSWVNQAQNCRAAFRFHGPPGDVWGSIGLRLSAGQELEKSEAEPTTAERS